MVSIPNSEYRNSLRNDGGPVVELLLLDELGLETDDPNEIEMVEVYYSDKPIQEAIVDDTKQWLRIMTIQKKMMTIYPVQQRSDHRCYGEPLYGSIDTLFISSKQSGPYELPTSIAELDELLLSLPIGFYTNWRYGLGLKWENRSILTTIAEIPGVTSVCFHAPSELEGTDKFESHTFFLGMNSYHRIRKELSAAKSRHQRAALREKLAICHNQLLYKVLPDKFEPKKLQLPEGALADLTISASGKVKLSKRDQQAALRLLQGHTTELVKAGPAALLRLKQDIELVSLKELIERCTELLEPKTSEKQWQNFLSVNSFVLTMAFHFPVIKIRDLPYVGGKLHTGQGGVYSDFLLSAAATNNLALVEIKCPKTPLMGSSYSDIYPPSRELSCAVAQVLAQRAELQSNFNNIGKDLDRKGYRSHAIACVVIIGLNPTDEEVAMGFEQYRQTLHGVHVVTFDELVDRLKSLYNLLTSSDANIASF